MKRLHELRRELDYIIENKISALVVYSQFNPITLTEVKMIKEARDIAKLENRELIIYSPVIQNDRNPLNFNQKQKVFSENFEWAQLQPCNTFIESIEKTTEKFNRIKVVLPPEQVAVGKQLEDCLGIEVINSEHVGTQHLREMALTSLRFKPLPFTFLKESNEYTQQLCTGARVELKREYPEFDNIVPKFDCNDVVEHTISGDIAVVKSVKLHGMVVCESLIFGTPEIYNQDDLVESMVETEKRGSIVPDIIKQSKLSN